MTRLLSRAEKKLHIDTLQLPAGDEIPFFDDTVIAGIPPWRLLTICKNGEWFCFLDTDDYEWALQWLWFIIPSGYAVRSRQKNDPPGGKLIYLHREVLLRHDPLPYADIMIGDHINGCPLDNRKQNLRWATLAENAKNVHGLAWRQRQLW